MRKVYAFVLLAAILLSLCACGEKKAGSSEGPGTEPQTQAETVGEVLTEEVLSEESTEEEEPSTDEEISEEASEEESTEEELPEDPSKWTTEQIVEYYSAAMAKTAEQDGVQSRHHFSLHEKLPGKASILSAPVNKAMDIASKQPIDGLTGGYEDLTADDLKSASARKEGDYIIIELYPKVQVAGSTAKKHEGSVGHVVDIFEGIDSLLSYIEDNFSILDAKYNDDSVKFTYNDAYAKNVRINTKTGKMESGNWGYLLDLWLNDASLMGVKFNDFHCYIDYTVEYPA